MKNATKEDSQRPEQNSTLHTRKQINEIQRPALARDDLRGAFAGKENQSEGNQQRSTSVKSRKTESSKVKTPKV